MPAWPFPGSSRIRYRSADYRREPGGGGQALALPDLIDNEAGSLPTKAFPPPGGSRTCGPTGAARFRDVGKDDFAALKREGAGRQRLWRAA